MYTISREDLVKMIKKETNVGFKRVLENHLRVMDGLAPDCITCHLDDEEPTVESDVIEEETQEEGEDNE